MNEHPNKGKGFLSLFHLSHQWAWQGVFIGGVTPPRYNYAFAPSQRSYSRNIPKCTCNFARAAWVRYSSDWPALPDGPLRPARRRSWDPLITPRPDACVARSSRIFILPPEDQRRWMSSTFAPGVGFNAYAVWSSRTFGVRSEGGVPNKSFVLTVLY